MICLGLSVYYSHYVLLLYSSVVAADQFIDVQANLKPIFFTD